VIAGENVFRGCGISYINTEVKQHIQIVDGETNAVVNTINFDPIDTAIPPAAPDIQESFPTGIRFWHK